jgi:hypothetical protein
MTLTDRSQKLCIKFLNTEERGREGRCMCMIYYGANMCNKAAHSLNTVSNATSLFIAHIGRR